MDLSKDTYGIMFSTDILLVVFFLVLILGIISNIIDSSNDKIINPLEVAELERLSNEVVDNLINNPGTPFHWEELFNFDGVKAGLAIENSVNKVIVNTVSYKKIKILENNLYEDLIDKKIFNEKIKSYIAIYPIFCNITPFFVGDNISISNSNVSNIVTVNRTVKCDFYRDFAIVSVFNGKALDENIISFTNKNFLNNKKVCNHETLNSLTHSNSIESEWICKEFKIDRKNFLKNDYYLFFNDESISNDNYWILDDIKNVSIYENLINNEKINLNNEVSDILDNKSSMIFYIHFKVNKNNLYKFNAVLVEIPKEIGVDRLNIDYFKEQECYFLMKTWYS